MVNNKPNNNNTAKSRKTVADLTATGYDNARLAQIFKNINNYKAFAFDFDLTLTIDHTGGKPIDYVSNTGRFAGQNKSLTTLFGKDGLAQLFKMIQDIKAKGIAVYIVSRGEYGQLVKTFQDNFQHDGQSLLELIGGETHIYGAITTKPEYPTSETRGKYSLSVANENVWAGYKLDYLKDINRKYNSTRQPNILFFDDTKVNIDIIYGPGDNSTWVNGIQQDKTRGLNATLAIVSELLERRTKQSPQIRPRKLAGQRSPAPPPTNNPAEVVVENEPIFGTAPPRRNSSNPFRFAPIANAPPGAIPAIPITNPTGNTRPDTNTNAQLPALPKSPTNKPTNTKKVNRFAGLRNLMPTKNTFKRIGNKLRPTSATKKRVREGFRHVGEFGKAVVQGTLHRMGRKQLFYGNQTEEMKPLPRKKKGLFGRLLSGTRKRLPSMGYVKGLFGRKPANTRKASNNTPPTVQKGKAEVPEGLYATVPPIAERKPIATLFEKYNLYAKKSESGRVEYTFKDMEGNVVALEDLELPDYIAEDMRELAENKLDKFKADFVSVSRCNHDNINCHIQLINTLNNDPAIKRPEPEVISPPLPERTYQHELAVSGRRASGNNKSHARRASISAEEPPAPDRRPSNNPHAGPRRSGSSGQTKSNRRIIRPAPSPANISVARPLSGTQTRKASTIHSVAPPRLFNNKSTDFNSIVPGFLDAFKAKLSASENTLIKDNADVIATCINKPDGCNKDVLKTVMPANDSIRTILNTTLESLKVNGQDVGSKKRADVARRITQLFGN